MSRVDQSGAWIADLTGTDGAAAERALDAYAESCETLQREIAELAPKSDPPPQIMARWLALLALGTEGVGALLKQSVEAANASDEDRRRAIEARGTRLQAASLPVAKSLKRGRR